MTTPERILPLGRLAVVAEYADLSAAMTAFAGLGSHHPDGVIDVVPAARTIMVRFAAHASRSEILAWLSAPAAPEQNGQTARPITIDVVYDGADLDEVATILGLSREAVIAIHTQNEYRVAFTGFAPGFAYLVAPDSRLHIARRSSPRPRVPAGSVGLAGEFSGVYPRATPGGWQLIGRTGAALWDEQRDDPALLHPGNRVTFQAVREIVTVPVVHAEPTAAPGITVTNPGMQLLLQDLGRPGHAADGVTASGAADRASHNAANTAVGNPRDAATLELAFGGAEVVFDTDAVIAITGADAEATITRAPAGDADAVSNIVAVQPGTPTAIAAGGTLTFAYASHGIRSYLAVRGGWQAATSLSSRASDTLSGLGPASLAAGAHVSISSAAPVAAVSTVVPHPTPLAAAGDIVNIDVVFGPRDDWFTEGARTMLTSVNYGVSATSDRVGVRLDGDNPLPRRNTAELPSEGVVRGAIQVPANGHPVIFLADHPVTGGYPVIAVVVPEHWDRLAQLPPGTTVRFRES